MGDYYLSVAEVKQLVGLSAQLPNKSLGQNYLINEKVIGAILQKLQNTDQVFEIGAGIGTLTLPISAKVKSVVALEIDAASVLILKQRVANFGMQEKIRIVNDDILLFDLKSLEGEPVIVGSLPYNITSPILHKLLAVRGCWDKGIFIIQKEVAEKITQAPPKGSYWYALVNAMCRVTTLIPKIKPSSFWPQPKVESSMVMFEPIAGEDQDLESWSRFLHKVFSSPRKQIHRALLKEILNKFDVDSTARPGEVEVDKLQQIFKATNN